MSIWDTPTTDTKLDEQRHAARVVFIGQEHIKKQVEPFLATTNMPHILLTGDPGLGKTQFGRWVAYRREKPFYERLAPVRADYLPAYGVLLLDEVHRQKNVEELFPIMDKGLLSVIAATTKPDKLDSAFRSRFLLSFFLKRYSLDEMAEIIEHMSGGPVDDVMVLANASQGNPRVAERIVRTAQGLDTRDVGEILEACRITADGLSDSHFEYLTWLNMHKRPLGLKQLQRLCWMDENEFHMVERLLLERGLIELRTEGRRLSSKGEAYVSMLRKEGIL